MKQNKIQLVYIGIIYAFIYKKLKEKNIEIITTHDLKECIARTLFKAGGIPRCFTHDIIKDMEIMLLIKRINHKKYQILRNECEKKVNKFIWSIF